MLAGLTLNSNAAPSYKYMFGPNRGTLHYFNQKHCDETKQRAKCIKGHCPQNASVAKKISAATSENVPSGMCAQQSPSLIRIFTGRILDRQGCKVSSCGQRKFFVAQTY